MILHPGSVSRARSSRRGRSLAALAATLSIVTAGLVTMAAPASAAPGTPVLNYTSATFNGTSDYVDHTTDLTSVSGLSTGTIVARFQTTSAATTKTLFSVSNTSLPSSNLTLSVNGGSLHFEVRQNNTTTANFATNLTYPTTDDPSSAATYNDGRWHTVAVTVGGDGTRIYADGYQVHAGTSTAFFSAVSGLNGMWVGRNVDNGGGQWYYNGTIASTRVYNTALSATDVLSLSPPPTASQTYAVNQTFNGTSTYLDKTSDLPTVTGATAGTITASFSTTSTAAAKTLLSASDTTNPSSNITLSINNGALYFENRSNGTYATQLTVPGRYNDGTTHTVAVTVGAAGTILYADGFRVGFSSSTAYFSSVANLNGMWIARNADNGGGQWYFNGTIGTVRLYAAPLTDTEIKNVSNAATTTYQALFDNGYAGSSNYRIPALLTTSAGTLLAAADQRVSSPADAPNDINTVVRRSTNSGTSWSSPTTVLDYPGTGANGASAIDSQMVQDRATGRIYLLVDHFPGGYGQSNNQAGTGFDANGFQILTATGGATYALHPDGSVYTSAGAATTYTVDSSGNVSDAGNPGGNIYLKNGVDPHQTLLEAPTSYLKLVHSDDDGLTWSQPVDLNSQVKAPWMKFLGSGPGNGIQLSVGAHAGRLEFPVYYSNSAGVYSSATVYSDDGGATWHRSASPNDGRNFNGTTINSQTVTTASAGLHEPSVIQQASGNIVIYMRNSSGTGKVAVATSADGGATWGQVSYNNQLPDIFSQTASFTYPAQPDGINRVLFGNATRTGRQDGFLRLSLDGGATFPYNRDLKAGGYAYNSISVLPDGTIAVLWELQNNGLYFQKLPLSFLTNSPS